MVNIIVYPVQILLCGWVTENKEFTYNWWPYVCNMNALMM